MDISERYTPFITDEQVHEIVTYDVEYYYEWLDRIEKHGLRLIERSQEMDDRGWRCYLKFGIRTSQDEWPDVIG